MATLLAAVLADNHAFRSPFQAEHGFSVLLQMPSRTTLFDTGGSAMFAANAGRMNFELFGVNDIVISHGHYDHASGLPRALIEAPDATLYLHPAALNPQYHQDPDGRMRAIGMPDISLQAVRDAENANRLQPVDRAAMPLDDHTMLITSDGRHQLPPGWRFFTADADGAIDFDRFNGELSLLWTGDAGSLLVVGCAHTGLAEIITEAEKHAAKPIRAVLGGSHIDPLPDSAIAELAVFLATRPGMELHLGHCTGIGGFSRLFRHLPDRLHPIAAGMQIEFEL